jgi:hypothetical protein
MIYRVALLKFRDGVSHELRDMDLVADKLPMEIEVFPAKRYRRLEDVEDLLIRHDAVYLEVN